MYLVNFANCFLDFIYLISIIQIMNTYFYIWASFLLALLCIYILVYKLLSKKINKTEKYIVDIFLQKISKIPSVIEVMRPYVSDPKIAFDLITHLHSEWIIYEYSSIHSLLEHNARINDQYSFLMRLSMAIPALQKDVYFLYIRDFVMSYDLQMKKELPIMNKLFQKWNRFIRIKNITVIGYILPGREVVEL